MVVKIMVVKNDHVFKTVFYEKNRKIMVAFYYHMVLDAIFFASSW
jgi:hypothetical protein